MKFLLDTNAVIALLKENSSFLDQLRKHRPSDFGLPSIVHHELCFGAYKSQKVEQNLEAIQRLQFEVVPFSKNDALCAGEIRAGLKTAGIPIGPYDVLIAGQAVSRAMVLITHNVKEFERVPNLVFEDWIEG